jgi:methyltransferase (TIGR00027 family)
VTGRSGRGRRSASAQHVALVRADLHRRGVIDDPYAHGMLRAPWRLAARLAARAPAARVRSDRALAFLAARTLLIDAAVTTALDDGITQVVTIGAGYDSRPWRLARPGIRFVELDHPTTQADKRRRAPTGPGPAYAPLEVGTDPLAPALERTGWDTAAPGVAVVEGLTMYLDEAVVAELLVALAG